MRENEKLWDNLNRLAIITGILVFLKVFTYLFQDFLPIFGEVISHLFSALLPFILAMLIAFLLEPFVIRLMRLLRIRRPYAALLTLVLAIAVLGLFVFLIMARLYTELAELAATLPNLSYYGYFIDVFTRQIEAFEKFMSFNPQVQSTIFSSLQSLLSNLQDWAKAGSLFLLSSLAALPGFFIIVVVAIIATLLVSSSYPEVKRFFANLLPNKWRFSAQAISQDLGFAIVGFLRAEVILVSITGITITLGLLLLGNRYAFTLGFLSGFLDLLPIVGTGMLFVPWIIGLLMLGYISTALKILLLWVVTMVVRQIIEPKIMSHNIGLHPLPTLLSMYVGLKLLGGVGLLVGPGLVIIYQALKKAGILYRPK